jgi:hypothetical protein
VHPSVVVCKKTLVGESAEIREIGIRCDGVYSHGSTLADDIQTIDNIQVTGNLNPTLLIVLIIVLVDTHPAQRADVFSSLWLDRIPEQASQLVWSEEIKEDGKPLDKSTLSSRNFLSQADLLISVRQPLG